MHPLQKKRKKNPSPLLLAYGSQTPFPLEMTQDNFIVYLKVLKDHIKGTKWNQNVKHEQGVLNIEGLVLNCHTCREKVTLSMLMMMMRFTLYAHTHMHTYTHSALICVCVSLLSCAGEREQKLNLDQLKEIESWTYPAVE